MTEAQLINQESIQCSQEGELECPEGYRAFRTLSGAPIWEPRENWGMDYNSLKDALEMGCIPAKE